MLSALALPPSGALARRPASGGEARPAEKELKLGSTGALPTTMAGDGVEGIAPKALAPPERSGRPAPASERAAASAPGRGGSSPPPGCAA